MKNSLYIYILLHLGVISLIGNGLAAHVFRRKGRDISVAEVLLLNIAIVDLFLAGASYPASIISAFSHRWIFEDIGKVSRLANEYLKSSIFLYLDIHEVSAPILSTW